MCSAVIAFGVHRRGYGKSDGPHTSHPPSSFGIGLLRSHAGRTEPLRPACQSWMPILASEFRRQNLIAGLSASACFSPHKPRSTGVLRAVGLTAVASMQSEPAPEIAMLPRCIMCQSVAQPSTAEHWPIGDTIMRLAKVTDLIDNGVKRNGLDIDFVRPYLFKSRELSARSAKLFRRRPRTHPCGRRLTSPFRALS